MAELLEFTPSPQLSFGIELELQVVGTTDYNLTQGASYLLRKLRKTPGDIKHEVTESMLEIATGVHTRHAQALDELRGLRDALASAADKLNLILCGGGTHPFQHWDDRRIVDNPRYKKLSKMYGYLAKQFTVFGQHIHIGCPGGDDAIYLLHALADYVPHFIALSASSPFQQGVDTQFASSRPHAVSAFPLAGHAPWCTRWHEFETYFGRMQRAGVVASMKDFYWDIRPKPEYGTVEIRVCDTPLSLQMAAALAAYAQTLAQRLLRERVALNADERCLAYSSNRFNACRYGLDAELIDVTTGTRRPLAEDVLETIDSLADDAAALESTAALAWLAEGVRARQNGAAWQRREFAEHADFPRLVRRQAGLWRQDDGAPGL